MPPAYVSGNQASSSGTNLNISAPATLTAGNIMVCCLYSATSVTFTWGAPSGWTQRAVNNPASTAGECAIFTKTVTGSEPASYTFTTPAWTGGIILQFSGAREALDGTAAFNASTSSVTACTAPSQTPLASNDMLITVYGSFNGRTFTTPTGMTAGPSTVIPSGVSCSSFYEFIATPSSTTGTVASTQSSASTYTGFSFLLLSAPYRFFPTTNGPSTGNTYSGNFVAGISFRLTNSTFLTGYYMWVPGTAPNSTAAVKCAMWQYYDNLRATVVAGTVVTSGTLTAGQWNWIPLSTPIGLYLGQIYMAAIGINGNFPETYYYFSTGGAGVNGITNGPLRAYSDLASNGGTDPQPNSPTGFTPVGQGLFSTSGSDPAVYIPNTQYQSSNFWVDVQFDDAPPSYTGPYRLWPSVEAGNVVYSPAAPNNAPDQWTLPDANVDYVVATEFHLSQPCRVNNIWTYSQNIGPTTAQLPTSVDIWSINIGDLTGTSVYSATPSWSGAAASGWVKTAVSGVVLTPGRYKVSIYNNSSTPDQWSAKRLGYWGTSSASVSAGVPATVDYGVNGIAVGPMFAPPTSLAATCYSYQPSSGTPTEVGQSSFSYTGTNVYPNYYVGVHSPDGDLFQNYWIDIDLTVVTVFSGSGTGGITFAGTGTATLGATVTGTGSITFAGTGTATWVPPPFVGGTGSISFDGTGTATLPALSVTGTGQLTFSGVGFADPPPGQFPTYLQLKYQSPSWETFLECLTVMALRGFHTNSPTPFTNIRDSTLQTSTMRNGAMEDRFLQCASAIATGFVL